MIFRYNDPMRTIDENFTQKRSFWALRKRDFFLLIRISQMLFGYLAVGRKLRKHYAEKEAAGEIYYVDEELQP